MQLTSKRRRSIGIDIGGTHMVFGLVDEQGNLQWKQKVKTDLSQGFASLLAMIGTQVDACLMATGLSRQEVQTVGIGMPGRIDAERGICLHASNLNLRDTPVATEVARVTGMFCYINNDVRMYNYGEAIHGAGKNKEYVLGVTIGTGMAGAMIVKGEPYGGYDNRAGEIGHIPIEGGVTPCNCGMIGCLETIVSAPGLARSARNAIKEGVETVLATYHPEPASLTAADVSRAYDAGDVAAIEILNHAGSRLGQVLAMLIPMLSPDVIIIGGGVALAEERLLQPVRETLSQLVSPAFLEGMDLTTAQYNDDAGVIGAAAWATRCEKGVC